MAKYAKSLSVLVVVLLLLRGPIGTWDALVLQVQTLLGSFLGTGDGLSLVVLHTLPLAGSVAIVTILVAREVLTFESFGSVVGLSIIVAGKDHFVRATVLARMKLGGFSGPPNAGSLIGRI
ncbi:MAG: hypothetical protein AAF483_03395, partial [Planctomycetota bacterium]